MADTSELLRLATDGSAEEYWHACADPALKASKLATALKSRLQAEAQAPASVLTLTADDVEVLKSAWCREAWNSVTDSYHYSCNYCAAPDVDSASDEIKHTADCLTHRLTVGAPAPAATMPKIDDLVTPQIVKKAADAGERVGWETVLTPKAEIHHRVQDLQKYEAALKSVLPDILALFAKGDTP